MITPMFYRKTAIPIRVQTAKLITAEPTQSCIDKDFVGNKWIPFLLGTNDTIQGACKGLCYPHSSYFAEVPEQYQRDASGEYVIRDGKKVETEAWEDYTKKWGVPKMGNDGKYINHAVPKLVVPNKPNGEKYEENPF